MSKKREYRRLDISKEKLEEITIRPNVKNKKILLDRNNERHRYIY